MMKLCFLILIVFSLLIGLAQDAYSEHNTGFGGSDRGHTFQFTEGCCDFPDGGSSGGGGNEIVLPSTLQLDSQSTDQFKGKTLIDYIFGYEPSMSELTIWDTLLQLDLSELTIWDTLLSLFG